MSLRRSFIQLIGIRTVTPLHARRIARVRYAPFRNSFMVAAYNPPPPRNLKGYAECIKSLNVHEIHENYPPLVDAILTLRDETANPKQSIQSPLKYDDFLSVFEVLATSGNPADLQRIETMLFDMSSVFDINPTADVYTSILKGLLKHQSPLTLQRWLLKMPRLPGHFSPTLEQFHMVLEGCQIFASFKFMRNLVATMRNAGCRPSNETFKILISSRWQLASDQEKIPHIAVFSTLIDDMKREGLSYDSTISSMLYGEYVERGFDVYAEEIRSIYDAAFPSTLNNWEQRRRVWYTKLSNASQLRGTQAAIEVFRKLQPEGCASSAGTIKSILRYSRNPSDIYIVEKELAIRCTCAHWSILINNNVRSGYLNEALSVYKKTQELGLVPDAGLVAPLIYELCQSNLKPPSETSIDQALALYEDLVLATPVTSQVSPKENYSQHSVGPDSNIYQTLLRGLASSPNIEKYYPIAMSLLDDMKSRNLSTTDSFTASSLIILFMRRCQDSSEALDVYRSLRHSLDEKGYIVVLNAFTKLTFGQPFCVPSIIGYFSIVQDMREADLPISVEVYTIILHQFGVLATQLIQTQDNSYDTAELFQSLITSTRRTHDLLTLDASVSPDAYAWNQLMDTYQRLRCFADSYRVWEMMYLSGRYDHVSVSIILDACGYAGSWQIAKHICTKLFRDNFVFNLHNWNTWLECLCRLGRLSEAVEVACLEMGKIQNSVAPDEESVRILIKFSKKTGQEKEVLSRIQRYLPHLWKFLPPDLQQ